MKPYEDFLNEKKLQHRASGLDVSPDDIHPSLFPFQKDLTRWAIRKGKVLLAANTGLGKTRMFLEYARLIGERTLIIAPLVTIRQTIAEAHNIDIHNISQVNSDDSVNKFTKDIYITNYERAKNFSPDLFDTVICDESSIFKNIGGAYFRQLTAMFRNTPYKLCSTATPAPNDILEIANHAQFLGIMKVSEMKSAFFVHRSTKKAHRENKYGWQLKGHATEAFYRWLASWCMAVTMPSDLGYSDEGFILPEMNVDTRFVRTDYCPPDQLFFTSLKGVSDRANVRQATLEDRCKEVAKIVNGNEGPTFVCWCGLNAESELLTKSIPGAKEITGSQPAEEKADLLHAFQQGEFRVLVTKPKIAGYGVNLQYVCHNQCFVGLSDSWESYRQAWARLRRFGQKYQVNTYVVLSEVEDAIWNNVMRKQEQADRMIQKLVSNVAQYERMELEQVTEKTEYITSHVEQNGWEAYLGDSCERLGFLESDSIDLSVFSPPFAKLYAYTPTERDLANSKNEDEFFEHFDYIIKELLRVTKPGRVCAMHVADIPAMKVRDGFIGMKDFSGDVIRHFIAAGWIFDARIPIDKNQQAQSIRTHAKALTKTQWEKDRSWLRPALPDYILKFRKPGENKVPVKDNMTFDEWIEWANPTWPDFDDRCKESGAYATWYGINESETLQGWQSARAEKDEVHICPLQLPTIERCIRLWTNPGEVVLDPFGGIGSTGYVALQLQRKAILIELKESYFKQLVKNMERGEREAREENLFAFAGIET